MRSHGVPDFPDPVNGRIVLQQGSSGTGVDPQSAAFQTASRACRSLAPAGTASAAPSAQASGKAVRWAQCIRSHGVPNFPDPKAGASGTFSVGGGPGVDMQSSQFQRAAKACQSLSPFQFGGGGQ